MIIEMEKAAVEKDVLAVVARIKERGFKAHVSKGEERTIIGVLGSGTGHLDAADDLEGLVLSGAMQNRRAHAPCRATNNDGRSHRSLPCRRLGTPAPARLSPVPS